MTLSPLAYLREAERLVTMSKLARTDGDVKASLRFQRLARNMERRAN